MCCVTSFCTCRILCFYVNKIMSKCVYVINLSYCATVYTCLCCVTLCCTCRSCYLRCKFCTYVIFKRYCSTNILRNVSCRSCQTRVCCTTECYVVTICTKEVLSTAYFCNKCTVSRIYVPNCLCCTELSIDVCSGKLDVEIVLCRTIHKVYVITAFYFFSIKVNCLCDVCRCCEIVSTHCTCEVVCLLLRCLIHFKLEG